MGTARLSSRDQGRGPRSQTRPRRRQWRRTGRTGKSKVTAAGARYDEGYRNGYREGAQSGLQRFDTLFEGTSIIIPTYNQAELLKQCIDSIQAYTELPYEVIVVDNASSDGTADYLKGLNGIVRYRILDVNQGFAGAINIGMMMAKGQTMLLLNNDTIVTAKWLDNMLACLMSDPEIGMVGPVTNYISGDQQIQVPYGDLRDMPAFAAAFNQHDPGRWRSSDRLVGFCLLFRRSLFQEIGYFDEGYAIGNFEDDDFNLRVRLLGRRLLIAGDTFIHHIGSVSIKALGTDFKPINAANQHYYEDKWHQWPDMKATVQRHLASVRLPGLADMSMLAPSGVAVYGCGANIYWIEKGTRRLVEGVLSFPAVRVSQVELKQWPLAAPIGAEEAEQQWACVADEVGRLTGVVRLPDGAAFHLEGEVARKIVGSAAMQGWNLHLKPYFLIPPDAIAHWGEGLPIIAPTKLRQVL